MYGLSGSIEKMNSVDMLNVQNCVNWGNFVHRMYRLLGFAKNLNIVNCVNSRGNFVHYMYGLSKFIGKLNFVDTSNVQNCINPTGNRVYQMYRLSGFAENLNLLNSALDVRILWIRRKIEHPELRKLNRKLCTLCVRIVWI